MKKIVILDTSIGTGNKGDNMIVNSTKKALGSFLTENDTTYFPTHTVVFPWYQNFMNWRSDYVKNADYKFIFGTNLLKTNMRKMKPQWNINFFNCMALKNTILVGVGNSNNSRTGEMNQYTKRLWKKVLSQEYIHSVRDDSTKEMLESMGFKAINTGCPTLWGLDEKHCSQIPKEKAKEVVFCFHDENKAPETDQKFLDMLIKNYDKLYFWAQSVNDVKYLNTFKNIENIEIIPPSLEGYGYWLDTKNVDYVGMRLHGGIFAMQHKKRAIIVSVDHRAKNINKTNKINSIPRTELTQIEEKINTSFETKVFVDYDKINEWMSQFEGMKLFENKFENKGRIGC